jgi:hypothetical protein
VYDPATIRARVAELSAFDVVRYAQKANSNLAVLDLLRREGVLVDAVSAGEIQRAFAAGYPAGGDPPALVYTADVFDREALDLVVEHGLAVNCGSPEMIDQYRGMADGATASGLPLTYAEALARQTGTRAFPGTEPPGSESDTLPPAHSCSVWAAWGATTSDGSLIGCDSMDAPFGFQVVTIAFPSVGNHYIVGNGLAMNDKGVWMGGQAGEAESGGTAGVLGKVLQRVMPGNILLVGLEQRRVAGHD